MNYNNIPGVIPRVRTDLPGKIIVPCRRLATGIGAGDLVVLGGAVAELEKGKAIPVKKSTTADDELAIGFVVADDAGGGVDSLVWVQVAGLHEAAKINGNTSIAAGDLVSCYTAAGVGKKASNASAAIAVYSDATYATNATAAKRVFIKNRFGLA